MIPIYNDKYGEHFTDDFLNFYKVKNVPISNIKSNDPYYLQLIEHYNNTNNPHATFLVDENGYYIPASRQKLMKSDFLLILPLVENQEEVQINKRNLHLANEEFDRQLDNLFSGSWAMPHQIVGSGLRNSPLLPQTVKNYFGGGNGAWNDWLLGNNGIVTDNFAYDHPNWSTAANLAFDFAPMFPKGIKLANNYIAKADNYLIRQGRMNYGSTSLLPKPEEFRYQPLTYAERMGLPKHERSMLTLDLEQALEDLYRYINNGRHRGKLLSGLNGPYWGRTSKSDQSLLRHLVDSNVPNRGRIFRFRLTKNTYPQGTFHYVLLDKPSRQALGYSASGLFPDVEGVSYKLGEASMTAEYNPSIILTSPKVDASQLIDNLLSGNATEKELGLKLLLTLPNRIPKDIMRDFWRGVEIAQRPGTYLSGDSGRLPLGRTLINDYIDNRLTGMYPNLSQLIKSNIRGRTGLSPDSYLSIIKQGLRDGKSLRWGEGFPKWNNSAVDNANIYDAWTLYRKGQITLDEYKKIFDDWIIPKGGRPLEIVKINGIELPLHPHPFVYKWKFGGKLNNK